MALGIGAYVSPPSQRYSALKWIRKLARDRWLAQLVEHLAGPSCRKINLSQSLANWDRPSSLHATHCIPNIGWLSCLTLKHLVSIP